MDQRDIILGGIALAVGLLIGLLFGPRGPGIDEIQGALDERLASVEGATSGAADNIAALQTRLDETATALQTRLDETATSLQARLDETASGVRSEVASLGERMSAMESAVDETAAAHSSLAENLRAELSGSLDSIGSAISQQSESLQSRLAGLRGSMGDDGSGTESDEDQAQPAAAAPAAADPDFAGIGAGQTAAFGDGALRAFVSRVDPESRTARLSVNGAAMELAAGESVDVETADGTFCHLMLSALQGNQVALNAQCGDELSEPEGVTTGNTLILGEGVRVFVSSVADDGGSARIAINGVETQTVEVGDSVDVTVNEQPCQITLDDIDRGHVALSTTCG